MLHGYEEVKEHRIPDRTCATTKAASEEAKATRKASRTIFELRVESNVSRLAI